MEPLGGKADWQATLGLAQALGCDWNYEPRANHAGNRCTNADLQWRDL